MSNYKPRIGLFVGDVTGIGPEITVKVVAQRKALSNCFIIGVGDHRVFQLGQRIAQVALDYPIYDDIDEVDSSTGNFVFLDAENQMVARILGYEATMDVALIKAFKPKLAANE